MDNLNLPLPTATNLDVSIAIYFDPGVPFLTNSIALKKLYICWKLKDIFIHVPIRMVQPPKCCVCWFDWWILWYASFQHVSQPLLHNSTNDETQSFILIWIQITSKTNDMKMQIMKLMIWKDVYIYIYITVNLNFHSLSLANGTLNHWAATFSCHNLSGAMPVLDTWKFAGNGAVLKRQFFNVDGRAWKWCWEILFVCIMTFLNWCWKLHP